MHTPVNHPLRPVYRTLAGLAALYILIFGIIGLTKTKGTPAFSQDNLHWVLGLRTNLAFAVLSVAAGAVLLASVLIGRNIDYYINVAGGAVFMVAGILMLGLLRTNANFLGFSVSNCIVSFIIGTVLMVAGLYGRTGTEEDLREQETHRHSGATPPPIR